jgi:hypothetical protein
LQESTNKLVLSLSGCGGLHFITFKFLYYIDVAFAVDYSKGGIDDGIVDNMPNKIPMPLKSSSPPPLQKLVGKATSSRCMGDSLILGLASRTRRLQMRICMNKGDTHESKVMCESSIIGRNAFNDQ